MVFLGTAPEDVIHEEESRFDASTGEVYLQLRLPYAVLEQASEEEVLGLMARRYLEGLRDLAGEAQVADFDWERLLGDVQGVLGEVTNGSE